MSFNEQVSHVTPILRELHCLPFEQRIEFKILLFTYKTFNDIGPNYIQELLETYIPQRQLRSATKMLLT